jgi:hypothetical protein
VTPDAIEAEIRRAFASVERPGNWALRGSDEGEEPFRVEAAFADKDDWRSLDAAFLDAAPDGLASALSFLSDEAFRYFLPAYLIADLRGRLDRVDPVFHLCHAFADDRRHQPVNPRRYGARTWFDVASHRMSAFTADEARAIAAYLRWREDKDDLDRQAIEQAVRSYWSTRTR